VVINTQIFSTLRQYNSILDIASYAELKKGLIGWMWGARIWVDRNAQEIRCYGENSQEFGKQFPTLSESKKKLKIQD
jgi:hypothetical protein